MFDSGIEFIDKYIKKKASVASNCAKCDLICDKSSFHCCILNENIEDYWNKKNPRCPIIEFNIRDLIDLLKTPGINSKQKVIEILERLENQL